MPNPVISFKYMNHNGSVEDRTIDLECLEFINQVGFGYQAGWFLSGRCHKKDARRSFSLSRIIFDEDVSKAIVAFRIPLGDRLENS